MSEEVYPSSSEVQSGLAEIEHSPVLAMMVRNYFPQVEIGMEEDQVSFEIRLDDSDEKGVDLFLGPGKTSFSYWELGEEGKVNKCFFYTSQIGSVSRRTRFDHGTDRSEDQLIICFESGMRLVFSQVGDSSLISWKIQSDNPEDR